MEYVISDSKQNARANFKLASDLQKLPCFGQKWCFLCFRVFEKLCTRVYACYNLLKLFEMNPKLAFIRWMRSLDFCKFLAFEEKLEVTMPKPVQAC